MDDDQLLPQYRHPFFVEEDRVLFTGDVVMSVFPAASAQAGSIDKW